MKYYEITFTLSPCTEDGCDVLCALAGDAGCETFEQTATGIKAYIQQTLFNRETLQSALADFPFCDIQVAYEVREAENRDWNEQWEQQGFDPIIVTGKRLEGNAGCRLAEAADCPAALIIHDGRHLPHDLPSHSQRATLTIEIDAHQAFGTGNHETTRMLCAAMLGMNLAGCRVLDCGCGTGILGICALKLGAGSCTAYDIDEWSADNTRHNAIINGVDDRLTVCCSDATVLDTLAATQAFDLLLANINRNVLLSDLPRFRSVMATGAALLLSGFYNDDCPLLEEKARQLGLTLITSLSDGDWACMVFRL